MTRRIAFVLLSLGLAACAGTARPPAEGRPETVLAVADARFTSWTLDVASSIIGTVDLDQDGHADLLVGGEPEITLFRGDGAGGLTLLARATGGKEPNDFAVADLDGDGHVDIVIPNHDTHNLTILLGEGAGRFVPADNSPLRVAVSPHPHTVRLADLDEDGRVDLLVDHRDGAGVLVLRGLGGGQLETPGTLVPVGGDPYLGMALGDLDKDGRVDLVTPNPDEVGVLLNRSGDGIAFVPAAPVQATDPFAVALGDFDGDGLLDLLTAAGEGSAVVQRFLGDGEGGFAEAADSPYQLAHGGKNIVVGDFNGDGVDDAAVSSYQSPDVLVLLGGPVAMKVSTLPGGRHPWGLAAADLNEDGRDDLIVVDDSSLTATIYLSLDS